MITIYVMDTCPDCKQVKAEVADDSRIQLIDIGLHARNLKEFLALRDHHPAFDRVKERGNIGIPCILMEDGSIDFSWERSKQKLQATASAIARDPETARKLEPVPEPELESELESELEPAPSCSLDGKGC